MEFVIEGESYLLDEGILTFKASLPHRWRNLNDGRPW